MIKFFILVITILLVAFACGKMKTNRGSSISNRALLSFADLASKNNLEVNLIITTFLDDKNVYFRKFENDLYQRGIESPEEVTKEIVLIEALLSSGVLVYVDYKAEADLVLSAINELSSGEISKNQCFDTLISAYKDSGEYNAIGNFLYDSKIAPMPFDCIKTQGFSLLNIDEGSDSYSFILLSNEIVDEAIKYAEVANINLGFFN
jgi:hypothetical protein